MKCIVLQDSDGRAVGFMLCSVALSEPSGDCVFLPAPGPPGPTDTPGAEAFRRREAGEASWQVVRRDPPSILVRTPGEPDDLFVEFDDAASGRWGVVNAQDRRVLGRAIPAAPR